MLQYESTQGNPPTMKRPTFFITNGYLAAAGLALLLINPPAGALLVAASTSAALASELI